MSNKDDTIDLREVTATLGREKLWVLGGLLFGIAVAVAVLVFVRPSYRASATALLQAESQGTPSALAMLGGLADALPTAGGGAMDTELQLLTSRTVYGAVVDSLSLQATVVSPRDWSITQLLSEATFAERLPERTYTFVRQDERYRVEGGGHRGEAAPGVPYQLPGAVVTLRRTELPNKFKISLITREEAIDRLQKQLLADEAGGDVARLVYDADDPVSAAAVPNLVIAEYLHRRRTTDRGVNQHRYEFLRARADSVVQELADASEALRMQRERSGVIDPEIVGEAEIEGAMRVRTSLEMVQVEIGALQRLLSAPDISGRALAAFPTLLASPAVNEVVALLAEIDTQRETLLERRTPRDPEVLALARSAELLERQLANLARDYLSGLREQEIELLRETEFYEGRLAALPAQAKEYLSLRRDVERLTQTELILQAQLIDARLAAIGEGGNMRQIDVAVPPEEPNFPRPLPTLLIGLFGGLVIGSIGALGKGFLSQRIRHPYEAEMAAGVPAVAFTRNMPLLIGGLEAGRTALVIPLCDGAALEEVAHQIALTGQLQGKRVAVVDLASVPKVPALLPGAPMVQVGGGAATDVSADSALAPSADARPEGILVYRVVSEDATAERIRAALDQLEEHNDLVVAMAPPMEQLGTAALLSPKRLVILVAEAGQITRPELQAAVTSLDRLGISVPGVVLTNGA